MHRSPVVVLSGSLLLVAASVVTAASPDPGGDVPRVTDVRSFEIEDTRLVSMSPDGSLLVGVQPAIGYQRSGQLCTFDVATLAQQACADLSGLGAGLRLEDIAWSPDGRSIAFGENAFQLFIDGDLWLMDTATGQLRNLDDDGFEGSLPFGDAEIGAPISFPTSPAFSPDGSLVAFSRSVMGVDGSRSNVIVTVPVAGGPLTEIATVTDRELGWAYQGMAWSPDGTLLYVSIGTTDGDDLRNGVWVAKADGSGARLFVGRYQDTRGPAVLDVSRDGQTLLLQDAEAMGAFASSVPVYATADTAQGVPLVLVPLGSDAGPGAYVLWAGFSPDGRWVATVERGRDPDPQVRVRALGSDEDHLLLDDDVGFIGPVDRGLAMTWAPNGTLFLTGGGDLDKGVLLTIEGGIGE